jgi:putative phosphonate metabolism protein
MRYAIYYVPARDTPLAEFGAGMLGYDLARGSARDRLDNPGIGAGKLVRLTRRAARYGFHATLKAPFALAAGCSRVDLLKVAADVADRYHAIEICGLEVTRLGNFFALTPERASPELNGLAAAFVQHLDPLRAVQARDEVKWPPGKLSARQSELLDTWGYPYVFDQFRFHMTLTDALDADAAAEISGALRHLAKDIIGKPFMIDAVTVVEETGPAAPFRGIARLRLRGPR